MLLYWQGLGKSGSLNSSKQFPEISPGLMITALTFHSNISLVEISSIKHEFLCFKARAKFCDIKNLTCTFLSWNLVLL
jgi:hypothetical protein